MLWVCILMWLLLGFSTLIIFPVTTLWLLLADIAHLLHIFPHSTNIAASTLWLLLLLLRMTVWAELGVILPQNGYYAVWYLWDMHLVIGLFCPFSILLYYGFHIALPVFLHSPTTLHRMGAMVNGLCIFRISLCQDHQQFLTDLIQEVLDHIGQNHLLLFLIVDLKLIDLTF